jgi:hypothetical protein
MSCPFGFSGPKVCDSDCDGDVESDDGLNALKGSPGKQVRSRPRLAAVAALVAATPMHCTWKHASARSGSD